MFATERIVKIYDSLLKASFKISKPKKVTLLAYISKPKKKLYLRMTGKQEEKNKIMTSFVSLWNQLRI